MRMLTLTLALVFAGCSNPTLLTSPICAGGQWDLPAEYEGDYLLTIEESSSEYAGSWLVGQTQISMRRGAKEEAQIFVKNPKPQLMQKVREEVSGISICDVDGGLYYQEASPAGYRVSKLQLGPDFFTIAGIVFHPDSLRAASIPYYLLPKLTADVIMDPDMDPFDFDMLTPVELVVDNSRVDGQALLTHGKKVSLTYSLSRIEGSKDYGKEWVRVW